MPIILHKSLWRFIVIVLRLNESADHKNKTKQKCQRRRDGNGKERAGGHTLNVTTNGQNKVLYTQYYNLILKLMFLLHAAPRFTAGIVYLLLFFFVAGIHRADRLILKQDTFLSTLFRTTTLTDN